MTRLCAHCNGPIPDDAVPDRLYCCNAHSRQAREKRRTRNPGYWARRHKRSSKRLREKLHDDPLYRARFRAKANAKAKAKYANDPVYRAKMLAAVQKVQAQQKGFTSHAEYKQARAAQLAERRAERAERRKRICIRCGTTFEVSAGRFKYCPSCSALSEWTRLSHAQRDHALEAKRRRNRDNPERYAAELAARRERERRELAMVNAAQDFGWVDIKIDINLHRRPREREMRLRKRAAARALKQLGWLESNR
jgi:hypothetical protein